MAIRLISTQTDTRKCEECKTVIEQGATCIQDNKGNGVCFYWHKSCYDTAINRIRSRRSMRR